MAKPIEQKIYESIVNTKLVEADQKKLGESYDAKDGSKEWGVLSGDQRYQAITLMIVNAMRKKKKNIKTTFSDKDANGYTYLIKGGKVISVKKK